MLHNSSYTQLSNLDDIPDMKIKKSFQMGSTYFFHDIPGFKPHDNDMLHIIEPDPKLPFKYIAQYSLKDCAFYMVKHPADVLVEYAATHKPAMIIGKYLIPEIFEYCGLSFPDDLIKLKLQVDLLDTPHLYEKVIYDAYLENNAMFLTDEQRQHAYEVYLSARTSPIH